MKFLNEANDLANDLQLKIDEVVAVLDKEIEEKRNEEASFKKDRDNALQSIHDSLNEVEYKPLLVKIYNRIQYLLKNKYNELKTDNYNYDKFLFLIYRINMDKNPSKNIKLDTHYYDQIVNAIANEYVKIQLYLQHLRVDTSHISNICSQRINALWEEYYMRKLAVIIDKDYKQTLKILSEDESNG